MMMQIEAGHRGVRINFKGMPDKKDVIVLIDKMRCHQILINLISNSLKFSKYG